MSEYRASELGTCIKRQAAMRMGKKPQENAYDPLRDAFARGVAHEAACIAAMKAAGWKVYGEQEELIVPLRVGTETIEISGHPDCMVKPPGLVEALPDFVGEIKAPQAWDRFQREVYSPEPSPLVQQYMWQISFYMVCKRAQGMIICLDENYQIKWHVYEEPFYTWDEIRDRIGDVETIVKDGRLPKLCSVRNFPCPFYYLHEDARDEYDTDSVLDIMVQRLDTAKKDATLIDKEIKYCQQIIREHMGEVKSKKTENSTVTLYDMKRTTYDTKRMAADGIPIEDYAKESITKDIVKANWKGTDGDSEL